MVPGECGVSITWMADGQGACGIYVGTTRYGGRRAYLGGVKEEMDSALSIKKVVV